MDYLTMAALGLNALILAVVLLRRSPGVDKELLATPIGAGVTTLGIPIGLAVIVFTVIITGIYVRRANTEFDQLNQEIVEESK